MADIDNLTIEISAIADTAIKALNDLAQALNTVNAELDRIDPSRLKSVASAADDVNKKCSGFTDSAKSIKELSSQLNNVDQNVGNVAGIGNAAKNASADIEKATGKLKRMTVALNETSRAAGSGGGGFSAFIQGVKDFGNAIGNSNSHLALLGKTAKFVFKTIAAPAVLATKAVKGLGKANDATAKTAKTLAKELTRVSKMLKLMVTRMALRAVIKEVGNGFKSLALHSEEFNKSVSGLMNGAKKLGYSFSAMISPLINAFAPAILYVINLLIKLANVINQVFSALLGAGTWSKAKDFTDNWAEDIEAANKSAKELKKTVLGFDELNQLQEKYTSGGGDTSNNIVDMFEDAPIDSKLKKLADTIKKYANKLFDPIKKAWEKVGDFVKDSWKYAMDEILQLGKSVARDFWKVWEQRATQQIFENILKIIGYIGQAVGNLAKRFREAWDKNNTGYKILCNIRDIVLTITEHLKNMAKATAEWADNLDFSPILEKFNEWLASCKPVVDALMGIIEDFYTTVILPLGKWAIEEGGPQLLQVFIDFNEKVDWKGLREKLQKLWEHLEPFAETVGEGLIIFIDRCAQALAEGLNSEEFESFLDAVCDWMDRVDAKEVADGLEAIAKALLLYEGITFMGKVATQVSTFAAAVAKAKPIVEGFATLMTEGFVIGTSMLFDEFIRGTIFDPDEWEGALGTIYDYIGIFFNNAVAYISATLLHPFHTLKDAIAGNPLGTSTQKYLDDFGLQSIDEYKQAVEELKAAGKDAGGTYEDLIRRAKLLHQEQTTGLGITAGAAKAARTDVDGLQNSLDAWKEKTDGVQTSTDNLKIAAEDLNKALPETKDIIGKTNGVLGQAKDSASGFKREAEGLASNQKALADTSKILATETDKVKTSSDNVTTNYRNQKTETDNLNEALKKANEAYKNVKAGMEEPVKYAPVLNEAQKGIEDTLNGLNATGQKFGEDQKSVWENYELETANAAAGFELTGNAIQQTMDDTKTDIDKQTGEISKAFTKDKWTFKGVIDGLIATFKDALDGVKKLWNGFVEKINGKHSVAGVDFDIDLPKFAGGGFPKENGVFMANSSELVGKFSNGRTAVANNSQIVEGISAGVYNAVTAAMASSSGNNGGYIANTIVVDGEVIARTVTKAQQRQNMRFSPQMG